MRKKQGNGTHGRIRTWAGEKKEWRSSTRGGSVCLWCGRHEGNARAGHPPVAAPAHKETIGVWWKCVRRKETRCD